MAPPPAHPPLAKVQRRDPPSGERHRQCLECPYWYGAEDDEYGPCSLKTARHEPRTLTFGNWDCDEGFTEPAGKAVPETPLERVRRMERERGGPS